MTATDHEAMFLLPAEAAKLAGLLTGTHGSFFAAEPPAPERQP